MAGTRLQRFLRNSTVTTHPLQRAWYLTPLWCTWYSNLTLKAGPEVLGEFSLIKVSNKGIFLTNVVL